MMSRAPRNGFTLVEMLVALIIFSIIAAGALGLLRFSVDAEMASREKTGDIAAQRRLIAVWSADMQQAAPRPARDSGGAPEPALLAGENGDLLAITRSGWDNPSGRNRASLQRVIWRMDGNRLVRIGMPLVDGAARPEPGVMAELRASPALRFRLRGGNWVGTWRPQDPAELPVAVELTLPQSDGTNLRVVTLVGSGPAPEDAR